MELHDAPWFQSIGFRVSGRAFEGVQGLSGSKVSGVRVSRAYMGLGACRHNLFTGCLGFSGLGSSDPRSQATWKPCLYLNISGWSFF